MVDTSIALRVQAPQVDVAAPIQKAQQLLTGAQDLRLKQQEERTRQIAQDTAARELAAKRWLETNTSKFSRIDPKTGRREIDYSGLTTAMAEAGYSDLAPSIQASWAQNTAQRIANETNEQTRARTGATFGADAAKGLAGIITRLPPEQQRIMYEGMSRVMGQTSPEAEAAFTSIFGQSPSGQQFMAVYQGQLTAGEAEGLAQSAASGGVTPAERDAKSPISAAMRQRARAQGFTVPETASAAQVRQLPGFREAETAGVLPATAAADLAIQAGDFTARASQVRSATSAITQELRNKYGRPGSITAAAFGRLLTDNPALGAVQNAIADYNAANPNNPIQITDGFDNITRRLNMHATELEKQASTRTGQVQRPPGQPRSQAPAAAPAAAPANTVRVKHPDGRTGTISRDRLEDAKRRGFSEVR